MRAILWATILTLVASQSYGANWFIERTLVNPAGTKTDLTRATNPFVDLPKEITYWQRPTDTTTNQAIRLVEGTGCKWNDGTSAADIEAVDVDTGLIMWTLQADTNCDFSVTTDCAMWEPKSEMLVRFRQKTAGTDGLLSCSGPRK